MKNLLFFLCCIVSLSACNNQGGTTTSGTTDSGATKSSAVSTVPASSKGSCEDLALFHKGAVIEGITYDGSGNQLGTGTTTVQDVKSEGGLLVADVEIKGDMKTTGETIQHVQYKCDGKSLSYDLAAMMSNFSMSKSVKVEGENISFPISLSTGETLPEASYSIQMNGARPMTVKSTIKDRKVEGVEKITTSAGSWDCFKVTSTIEATVSMAGVTEKMTDAIKQGLGHQSMAMWFAPGFGIVKMEMYRNDKVVTRSEVTAIK